MTECSSTLGSTISSGVITYRIAKGERNMFLYSSPFYVGKTFKISLCGNLVLSLTHKRSTGMHTLICTVHAVIQTTTKPLPQPISLSLHKKHLQNQLQEHTHTHCLIYRRQRVKKQRPNFKTGGNDSDHRTNCQHAALCQPPAVCQSSRHNVVRHVRSLKLHSAG